MKISLYSPEIWFSDLSIRTKSPGGSLKHRLLGPTARESGSAGLGCGQRFCLSRKSVGDGDASGPGTTPQEPWHWDRPLSSYLGAAEQSLIV